MTEIPIKVLNLKVDNEAVEEVLMETLGSFLVIGQEPVCRLSIFVEHSDVVKYATNIVRDLKRKLPKATFLSVDRDLVGLSDIAQRVGVSREAVRKWSNSLTFPVIQGQVGGQGMRLWAWTQIVDWVQKNKGIDLEELLPTLDEMTAIDYWLSRENEQSAMEPDRTSVSHSPVKHWTATSDARLSTTDPHATLPKMGDFVTAA